MIRYFDPPYNEMFRHTFPNPAHTTYSECYDLDFAAVGIQIDTETMGSKLYSEKRAASWMHIAQFPLRSVGDKSYLFTSLTKFASRWQRDGNRCVGSGSQVELEFFISEKSPHGLILGPF